MGQFSDMVNQVKNGEKERFVSLIEQLEPLIAKYTRLLFKDEKEDVRSELILALWEAVTNMEYIANDGQGMVYFTNALRNKFYELYRKSKHEHDGETLFDELYSMEQSFVEQQYGDINMKTDVLNFLKQYKGKKYEIYYLIMMEQLSDSEISSRLNISRQYVNRQRRQLQNKLLNENIFSKSNIRGTR